MTTNFLPANSANMQPNEIAAANYINAIQLAGGSADLYGTVAHIASLKTSTQLEQAYDLLTADLYVSTQAAPLYNSSRFSEALLSCKQYDGEKRFVDEGDCAWMNVTQATREERASATRAGVDQDTTSVAAGAQRAISDHWHFGTGFSVDDGESQVAGIGSTFRRQHTTGNGVQLGAVLKGNFGAQTFSTSLVAGHMTYEATRGSFRDAQLATASSEYLDNAFAAHMRYGYAIAGKNAYVRPLLDAGFTRIRRDGFAEHGSGPTDLVVAATTDELVTLQPALEMGGELSFSDGTKVRGTARVGITRLLSGEDVALAARFESAPESVAPMTFGQTLDKQITEWALGIDVLNANGKTLRFTYSSSESEHSRSSMGMLKLSAGF
jgi:Autotransporter beta-domain